MAKDRFRNELEDLEGKPVPVNPDGTITLYHWTDSGAAKRVIQNGFNRSDYSRGESFFSTKPSGNATGYGKSLLRMNIAPSLVELDDAFRNGEVHVSIRWPFVKRGRNIRIVSGRKASAERVFSLWLKSRRKETPDE